MFNEIIVANFSSPEFAEELPRADLMLELGNPVCGDRIQVQLQLAGDVIQKARYQAWGCATSLATGNVFCGFLDQQPLSAVLGVSSEQIDSLLGELEPSQHHCLEMLRSLFKQLSEQLSDKTASK
jgi:nitrogen fixation NifU-like protein